MPNIGIRALKNQTTEILREVREGKVEYIVTYRGSPVALLLPLNDAAQEAEITSSSIKAKPTAAILAELKTLRQKIGRAWKTNLTAVEAVTAQRRDL